MQIFKLSLLSVLFVVAGLGAQAQGPGLDKQAWIKANLYYKQDAIDFINTSYKQFTPIISKKSTESGIYKLTVKLKKCELVIETESRDQHSYYTKDRNFDKNIVVIELDKVNISGNNITPSAAENSDGLFAGTSFDHSKKIPAYNILTPVVNKDDSRFSKLHYEEHLQWAYEFLIEEYGKK